jgi:hypothetical protein
MITHQIKRALYQQKEMLKYESAQLKRRYKSVYCINQMVVVTVEMKLPVLV